MEQPKTRDFASELSKLRDDHLSLQSNVTALIAMMNSLQRRLDRLEENQ